MLALYHFDRSTAAQRVRLALAEKGLAWESRYVDPSPAKREQHDPAYLALNPRGVVPTLVHDGRVIRESNVILEYLEDVFPAPALRPADPHERARMRLWTKQIDEWIHVDSRTLGQCIAMRFVTREAGAPAVAAHYAAMPEETRRENDRVNNALGIESPLFLPALRRFKRLFGEIDAALAEGPFLVGDRLSLADLSMVVYASRLESFQLAPVWADLPRLVDWHERLKQRPAYAEAVEKWGDSTAAVRREHGQAALPRVREMWQGA